ncbi:hypothetical protein BIWAKO_04753 [Bosea sp. BIWAKO-01]|nr:hypothetical protein BIWAKO_04753 [Bosea sp. BIWAKO-01]
MLVGRDKRTQSKDIERDGNRGGLEGLRKWEKFQTCPSSTQPRR